ncbi:hypothetical protein IK110_00460 [Candidatus Saccharibacteria bacterium]|nr:hypothetical protein [Candidatus Saccharibacteria bacterium]
MNEGENSGMSNGPIFSSPNIAGSQPEKQQGPVPMPEQPVDVTKTDNPIVTTTLASMPGDEAAKPIVTSGGDAIDKKKPRFGLGTRRFKEKAQTPDAPVMQAQSPAFANAPEFFNNAVGDIVLADAADAEKKNKTKKFIIIGAIAAVAVVVLVIGLVALIPKKTPDSAAKNALNRIANIYILGKDSEEVIENYDDYEEKSDTFMYRNRFKGDVALGENLLNIANEYFKEMNGLEQKDRNVSDETILSMQNSLSLIGVAYGTPYSPGKDLYEKAVSTSIQSAKDEISKRYARAANGPSSVKVFYDNAMGSMAKGVSAAEIVKKKCPTVDKCSAKLTKEELATINRLLNEADALDEHNRQVVDEAYGSFSEILYRIKRAEK